jgi:hypothetical protein
MDTSIRDLAIITLAVGLLLWSATAWIRALLHSWQLPACWSCGASKVRRSARHCLADALLKFMFLVPYRCRGCRVRFYGVRTQRRLAHPSSG